MIRVLFTGGGTGGHVYPLIAVARAIRRIKPDTELYFLGPTNFGREALAKEGITVYRLITGKLRRYADPRSVLDFVKMPVGFLQALVTLFWVMPDVIFSKGGYGSVPVVLSGRLYRIPVIIHESDALPGFANAALARFAGQILIAFPEARNGFRVKEQTKVFLAGNPVRSQLFLPVSPAPPAKSSVASLPTLLVLGGSQGAERLNDLLLEALPELLKDFIVIHQAGPQNVERVKREGQRLIPKELLPSWRPAGFLEEADLAAAYAGAACIISRAGAGAVFEIAESAKPSIMIPLTAGSRGEQIKNAYAYARAGGTLVLEETNLTPHIFIKAVRDLMADGARREKMSAAAKKFATPEAAETIAEAITGASGAAS